jgi:predicted small lipoprotein YifL
MKNALKITAAALCCLALVACSQKGPAEAALKTAETSMNEVQADGAKYAAEQTKGLTASYTAAQDAFNKGETELAQGIPAKAKDVSAAVAARKDELTKTWTSLASTLPAQIEPIKTKVDALSAMKKLPKGMDAARLDVAKTALADITKTWGEATEAFKSGDLIDAVAKGNAVKAKVTDATATLAPPAAPAAARKAKPAKRAKK